MESTRVLPAAGASRVRFDASQQIFPQTDADEATAPVRQQVSSVLPAFLAKHELPRAWTGEFADQLTESVYDAETHVLLFPALLLVLAVLILLRIGKWLRPPSIRFSDARLQLSYQRLQNRALSRALLSMIALVVTRSRCRLVGYLERQQRRFPSSPLCLPSANLRRLRSPAGCGDVPLRSAEAAQTVSDCQDTAQLPALSLRRAAAAPCARLHRW